jgi:hypothetical protein
MSILPDGISPEGFYGDYFVDCRFLHMSLLLLYGVLLGMGWGEH